MAEYTIVFAILFCTLLLFAWGKMRYDMVAILALLAGVFAGVIPSSSAFAGFGHPAVITVAAVLIISKALQKSGVVNLLAGLLAPTSPNSSTIKQIAGGSSVVAALSCFMNNVGALALMLPVTLQNASKAKQSPSRFLMPLSFASLLGGLVTLIGTPTNFVISSYREQFLGQPYSMFDFTPVGIVVAIGGLIYLVTIGWKLLPDRMPVDNGEGIFHVEDYITEVSVPEGSKIIGVTIRQLERQHEDDLTVMAILREGRKRWAPRGMEKVREGDTLVLEGDPAVLNPLIANGNLERFESNSSIDINSKSNDVSISEVVLLPNSPIEGQSMRGLHMHDRYGINLLAISRRGERPKTRLANTRFRTGDVLLLQGEEEALSQAFSTLGFLPLAERNLSLPNHQKIILPVSIFAVAIILAAIGVLSVPVAFISAVVALIMTKVIKASDIYTSIDWPIIILLGALIPVGDALQTSGGTAIIASLILTITDGLPVWVVVGCLLVSSMWLSDVIPNTPTAVLMAPIGATVASRLGVSADPFLMAVAIGCATPFLTPIGHQSNTLVMNPGGYRFTDYARVGIGLELVIILISVPMIMLIWPY